MTTISRTARGEKRQTKRKAQMSSNLTLADGTSISTDDTTEIESPLFNAVDGL